MPYVNYEASKSLKSLFNSNHLIYNAFVVLILKKYAGAEIERIWLGREVLFQNEINPRILLSHEIPLKEYAKYSHLKEIKLVCNNESKQVELVSTVEKPTKASIRKKDVLKKYSNNGYANLDFIHLATVYVVKMILYV